MIRSDDIVLQYQVMHVLNASVTVPIFTIVYAGPDNLKKLPEYLNKSDWVGSGNLQTQ